MFFKSRDGVLAMGVELKQSPGSTPCVGSHKGSMQAMQALSEPLGMTIGFKLSPPGCTMWPVMFWVLPDRGCCSPFYATTEGRLGWLPPGSTGACQ